MQKPVSVEAYIDAHPQWQEALILLRSILLDTDLKEEIKWAFPVYTWNKKNIVGLGATKSNVGVWFFQGATLVDEAKVLINAQEGKTQAMRQWRFTDIHEIDPHLLVAYINESIENQKSGNIIKFSAKKKPLVIPPELQKALDGNPLLAQHFEQFSLGNKRDFAEHIITAKQTKTKERRLEKIIPMILRNEGLNDKYKK